MKRILWVMGLALLLVWSTFQPSVQAAGEEVNTSVDLAVLQADIEQAAKAVLRQGQISEWSAVGLVRSDRTLPDAYSDELLKEIVSERGKFRLVTELERKIIGLSAAGIDAGDVLGYSLVDELLNHSGMTGQGSNGVIYALIALQSSGYEHLESSEWSVEHLVDWLLKEQNEDGGWSLTTDGDSDIDITGMALTALSPYLDQEAVKISTDKGAAWILDRLTEADLQATISSESISQAMIGLSSIGQNPHLLYEQLLPYRLTDGTYAHLEGEQGNAMATEQAFLALTAYELYLNDLPGVYEGLNSVHAEVIVEGPENTIVSGEVHASQALEAVQKLLAKEQISLHIEHSSYGRYITSIDGIEQGLYGGWDGWNYAVYRGGAWVPADEYGAMDQFSLQEGDRLYVYYNDDTQLIDSVTPGESFVKAEGMMTLQVNTSVWNWDAGKAEVAAAVGVTVQIGQQTVQTDVYGRANIDGLPAGEYDVKVTAYDSEKGALVVPFYSKVKVNAKEAEVSVRVEGPSGTLAHGRVEAANALQAVQRLLDNEKVEYEVKDSSFGQYITSIGGVEQGLYGEYDGWNYGVKRDGEWLPAASYGAMADFELQPSDELIVYYSHNTELIDSVVLEPSVPNSGELLKVKLTKSTWDWAQNQEIVTPAAHALVTLGTKTATADENGIAVFEQVDAGTYEMTITAYTEQGPGFVKEFVPVRIAPSSAADFSDQAEISSWAYSSVEQAVESGFIYGVSTDGQQFAPKKSLSRAEFISLLNRVLDIQPQDAVNLPYKDVPADAWYSGDVAAAIEKGYLRPDGETFEGLEPITRAEMALLTIRALDLPSVVGAEQFTDLQSVSFEQIPYIETAAVHQLIVGSDGKFMPHDEVSREMAAAVILRLDELSAANS
ncbi:S-layer homology domain-containing protein [Marinicrinis lubricantis]|uniref:S-layer homology domain-containing protein n=1 Tax=Marinicrinis lubricantis TaxID=2086470 RepID=A0ABW1IT98_9BACL